MSISISDYSVHLQDGLKLNREHLKSQGSQNENQKVFHKDTLDISQLSKEREDFLYRVSHTVNHSVTFFLDECAKTLKEVREEIGQYGYSEIVNACGSTYAKLYSDIEQRYENEQEQYYDFNGKPLTKEEEIEWLNMEYENAVGWYKSCARIELQAKDAYMKLHRENKQNGYLLT